MCVFAGVGEEVLVDVLGCGVVVTVVLVCSDTTVLTSNSLSTTRVILKSIFIVLFSSS